MPTVNGITYSDKFGICDTLTLHYEQACRATSAVNNDAYHQSILAAYTADPTKVPDVNRGGTLLTPVIGQTGDARYGTLDFIDWFMARLKHMGAGWYREWGAVPRYQYNLELQPKNIPITVSESDDWSVVDRIVQRCEEYGIQFVLTLPWPWSSDWGASYPWYNQGAKNVTQIINNWFIPLATFLANRYSDKTAFVQIDPGNEPQIMTGWTAADVAALQIAVYDAVKAVAPTMRVNLVAAFGGWLWNYTYDYDVEEWVYGSPLLNALNNAGGISKFDSHVTTHLYPTDLVNTNTLNWPDYEMVGILEVLTAYSRNDVNVRFDEFDYGIFNGTPILQSDINNKASAIDTFKSQSDALARVDGYLYWRLLCRSTYNYGFNTGASGEGGVFEFTSTFPPSTDVGLFSHIVDLGLYTGPITKSDRLAGTYDEGSLITLSEYRAAANQPVTIYYAWNNPNPTTEYTGPIEAATGILYWKGIDSLSNIEPIQSVKFLTSGVPIFTPSGGSGGILLTPSGQSGGKLMRKKNGSWQ